MELEFVNEDDLRRQVQEKISTLTEDKKTEYEFEGKPLYSIGGGHAFVWGFFSDYITKCGIEARQYSNWWSIKSDEYEYKDSVFVLMPRQPLSKPIDWNTLSLPKVMNVAAKTIGDDLEPFKPTSGPNNTK